MNRDIWHLQQRIVPVQLVIRYAKRIIKDGHGKTPTEIARGTRLYELVEELVKYLSEDMKGFFCERYCRLQANSSFAGL